jgi:hypothetical protein
VFFHKAMVLKSEDTVGLCAPDWFLSCGCLSSGKRKYQKPSTDLKLETQPADDYEADHNVIQSLLSWFKQLGRAL